MLQLTAGCPGIVRTRAHPSGIRNLMANRSRIRVIGEPEETFNQSKPSGPASLMKGYWPDD